MSYLRAYANTYPTRLNPNQLQTNQRRSIGILFAILVHVGLVVAIGSGLAIDTIFQPPPHLTVHAIDPPTIIPLTPVPIDKGTFIKSFIATKPQHPIIDTASTDTNPGDQQPQKSQPYTDLGNRTTQTVAAKVDPHHPLTQPSYPPISRRLGEQGTVELSLYILADGRIGETRIEHSSGFARLDEAAQQHAMTSWRLLPQQIDGIASAGWQRIAITFRLKK
jgi:protein TonB